MKVLGIVGTNRRTGTITTLVQEILHGAETNGIQSELINLYDYDIKYCRGCWACAKSGRCILKDDFEAVFERVLHSDYVVIGSPVYWANITAITMNFFNRFTGYAMNLPKDADTVEHIPSKYQKLRKLITFARDFGPKDPVFKSKKYILVTSSTAPFVRFLKEVPPTLNTMRTFVHKLKGRIIGELIYTDTLFRFSASKRQNMNRKAYNMGSKIKK